VSPSTSPADLDPLPDRFLRRRTAEVAKTLLGCVWCYQDHRGATNEPDRWVGGLIVETEAYLPADDLASHSARGPTRSNRSMFAAAGTLYVYPIHAKHCANIVTEPAGLGAAVLVRGLQPVWGIERMRRRRGQAELRKLTRGPGMICQAMALDRRHDGSDITQSPRWRLARGVDADDFRVIATRRIGIGAEKDADRLLRFFIDGNRFVSGKAGDHSRRPTEQLDG